VRDHQVRVTRAQRIGPQAQAGRRGGAVVVHEEVRATQQPVQQLATRIGAQVEHDRSLVAVDRCEVRAAPLGRVAPPRRSPGARLVAVGRLDLDDIGAEVGQQHGGERPGQHAADVDDADAFQGEPIGHGATVAERLARAPLGCDA